MWGDNVALINILEPHFGVREVHYTHVKFPRVGPEQYKCCELEMKGWRHWIATSLMSGWTFTDRSRLLLPLLQQLSCSTGTPRIMKETSPHLCHPDISWLQTTIVSLGRPNMTSILMSSLHMQDRTWVMWLNLIIWKGNLNHPLQTLVIEYFSWRWIFKCWIFLFLCSLNN